MKGLLIKDFKLIKVQKNFFLLAAIISISMAVFSEDVTFPLGFLTFVVSLFTLSTISYDELDNGNAFLFTLPITRTTYVIEKYCLGIMIGLGAWLISGSIAAIASVLKHTLPFSEIMLIAFSLLPLVILLQALMIPFQLKFGGEKGRIALIGAFGLVFVIGVVVVKLLEIMNIDVLSLIGNLPELSKGMLILLLFVLVLVLLGLSTRISISIMQKKEF